MKISMKVAFCGVMTALSAVIMFLSGLVPVATLAIPAIAGCLLISVVAEVGLGWGFGVYGACSLLSLLLVPDREAALFYVLFFGYYPVLFAPLSRVRNRFLRGLAKFSIFNAAVVLEALIAFFGLGIPLETTNFLGKFTPLVLLAFGNLVFLLYDHAMDGLIAQYFYRLHSRISRVLRM